MFLLTLCFSLVFTYFKFNWIFIIFGLIALYIYNFYKNNIWKELGVPYLTPLPLVGNDLDIVLGLKTLQDSQIDVYNKFGTAKFGGLFSIQGPSLFIKDPDLIEHVCIRDFSHFTDRALPLNDKKDPLIGHLFNLTGKRWKGLRNKLSPVFTSGKLKTMHQQLIDCADILIDILDISAAKGELVDFKETMAKFTTDVIGSCAYGLNMNSLKDPDSEFRNMGRRLFRISTWTKIKGSIRLILFNIHPKLIYLFKLPFLPPDINFFFTNLVHSTIKMREDNPELKRNDFIQMLMNLKNKTKTDSQNKDKKENLPHDVEVDNEVIVDDNTLAANSFLFFVAGFETTASTLSYCLFELAKSPEIQEKLYSEVSEALSKHGNQPTYEAIKALPLMDMVVSETLRMYPPVPVLPRICTDNYKIPDTDVTIPKGFRVRIPVYALHHDPNIYSDPEKFDPYRFSPENKESIPKGAYLPFGDGPRICIGARFAQMEIKVCLCKIISRYKIVKSPYMGDKIEFDKKSTFLLIPKNGIMLNVVKR